MGILKVNPHLHLKKISLKIWSLRDQVEALIRDKLEKSQENDISIDDYRELIKKFNEEWLLEDFFWEKTKKEKKTETEKPLEKKEEDKKAETKTETKTETETVIVAEAEKDKKDEKIDPVEKKKEEEIKVELKKTPAEIQQLIQERMAEYEKEVIAILNKRPKPPEQKIANGKTFLTDIDFKSINFFSSAPFLIGQSVLIEFKVPEKFIMSAEIMRCLNYNLHSRVISEVRPNYRIQAKFTFKRSGERTLMRKFLKGIMADFSKDKKKAAAAPVAAEAAATEAPAAGGDDAAALGDIAAMLGGAGGAAAT